MKTTHAQKQLKKYNDAKVKKASAYYAARDGMREDVKKYVNQFVKPKKEEVEEDDTSNQRRKG